jgi:hypothetical protein
VRRWHQPVARCPPSMSPACAPRTTILQGATRPAHFGGDRGRVLLHQGHGSCAGQCRTP